MICTLKALTVNNFEDSPFWATYSIVVLIFIFGRFGLAWRYRPGFGAGVATYLPSVAIIVPAYNEQDAIAATLRSCLAADYPSHLIQVVVVDDCSTDMTLDRIRDVEAEFPGLLVVAAEVNRGKRHVMAAGMQAARDADILVFIDSDSIIEPGAVRSLVRYFEDSTVGAVCGHTDVSNKTTNLLTRMQAMQYYIAFNVYKSAEALFGSVTCCSGCFSGYRRSAIEPITAAWVGQQFLGQPSTYGDDRSLTNFLLPDWRILFAPDAKAQTAVPDRLSKFLRQQLRWKKSWLRESTRAVRIMWRKPPLMAIFFYLGVLLPFVAPQVVFRAFFVSPHFLGSAPFWYLGGVAAVALFYGLYYRLKTREPEWYKGILFSLFYVTVLVAQLPYALLTIRDSKWGTR
jgi:hyaluronan synthase